MGFFSLRMGFSVSVIGGLSGKDRKESASELESNSFDPVLIEELDEEDYVLEVVENCSSDSGLNHIFIDL
jgi:hypothetical protein